MANLLQELQSGHTLVRYNMAEGIPNVNSVGFAENASMELVKELDVMRKKSEVFKIMKRWRLFSLINGSAN